MSVTLGSVPSQITVTLSAGADFVCTLESVGPTNAALNYPTGAQVSLTLSGGTAPEVTWAAAVAGNLATFTVADAAVDAVLAAKHRQARLWYVEGTTRLLWGKGSVDVR